MLPRAHALLLCWACVAAVTRGQVSDGSCPPEESCRPAPSQPVCSGRGYCECGECVCHRPRDPTQMYNGIFCECDNFSCDRWQGLLCGGPERGSCLCGRCSCRAGWSSDSCSCSTSTASCTKPGSDKVCSGRGHCRCGRCECAGHEDESYSGQYCDVCPTCRGDCSVVRPCVECLVFGSGPLQHNCTASCASVTVTRPDTSPALGSSDFSFCSFRTADECRYKFFIDGSDGSVLVPKSVSCPARSTPGSRASAAATPSVLVAVAALFAAKWQ